MRILNCLFALALVGCAHASPTTARPVPAKVWGALATPAVIAKAVQSGTDKPLQKNLTITLEGSLSLKLTYFWKPWAGQGFTTIVFNGEAVTPDKAAACADRIAEASLQPGVDAQVVRHAVELLREFAGV